MRLAMLDVTTDALPFVRHAQQAAKGFRVPLPFKAEIPKRSVVSVEVGVISELHVTQPAVSVQVNELEQHAGLPLLEQLGKKIYLTPAGHEMLRYTRSILQQFKEAEETLAGLKGVR